MTNFATWNVCLGLTNKKDLIINELRRLNISVCSLQEVEVRKDFPHNQLTAIDFKLEIEDNSVKARTAIYIKTGIEYKRRSDIEEPDLSIIVLDIDLDVKIRLINIYRVFNPVNGMPEIEFFKNQMRIVNNAISSNNNRQIIFNGDVNLDYLKINAFDYPRQNFFTVMNESIDPFNLIQLVDFPTWERVCRGILKQSTLDHIYVKDFSIVSCIKAVKQIFGDHSLIMFSINTGSQKPKQEIRRNWQNYSKEKLLLELSLVDFGDWFVDVQSCWNVFENNVIEIVDKLCPLVPFIANSTTASIKVPPAVKSKINLRKRLLKRLKLNKDSLTKIRISQLNIEIKNHFYNCKRKSVRQGLIPGNNKTLWDSVKIAKDLNINKLPDNMFLNVDPIPASELPDKFAEFFKNKIDSIVQGSILNPNVYNGTRKLFVLNDDFMTEKNILDAVMSLKLKNSEGFDRIPQRIIIDGIPKLLHPLCTLFNLIYRTKDIPEQWLISKIIPVFKKGDAKQIENYRPIANLCATSKIFEKLIQNKLLQIQTENDIDLTNKSQHGFKKKHSTNSAGLLLQSVLARALDDGNIALMASLDLSSAFDVVNVGLLLKRMRLLGLPEDIVSLCGNWLSTRYYYVVCGGSNSIIHMLDVGTVQGSILGPILYAIFVAPLFDLAKMTKFADDNFIIKFNRFLPQLLMDMKKTLEMIIKWLKDSGLKVNDTKTEICIFNKNDTPPITITINNFELSINKTINVLGVIFDSKLQWHAQVENAIKKSNKAKYAISIIKRYFSKNELNNLLTSNYYSILYYNADIWLIPSLKSQLKQRLLAASSSALKMINRNYDNMISFNQLHYLNKRATPLTFMAYKHSLLLFKIYNNKLYSADWLAMHFQQTFNARTQTVSVVDTSKLKIGRNIAINRLILINGKIPFEWLNLTIDSFKIKCKSLFL